MPRHCSSEKPSSATSGITVACWKGWWLRGKRRRWIAWGCWGKKSGVRLCMSGTRRGESCRGRGVYMRCLKSRGGRRRKQWRGEGGGGGVGEGGWRDKREGGDSV